jgi:signal transduction histidine kinase
VIYSNYHLTWAVYLHGVHRPGSGSRWPAVAAIAAPMAIAALLCVLVVGDLRDRARLQADARLRAAVAAAVTPVGAAIRSQLAQAARVPGVGDIMISSGNVSTAAVSAGSVIEARDSGVPVLDETARPPAIVVPVYGAAQAPRTTEGRRHAITAYRLVPLNLGPVLAGLTPDGGGLVVVGPTRAVAALPGPAPAGSRGFAAGLELDGAPGWLLAAWLPAPAASAVAWLWVVALMAMFAGVAAALMYLLRREQAAAARQRRRERDRSLVSGLAPVVQASLELADVLPAASAHLVEGLGLAGLSLSTPGETGERQLFSWGATPDARVFPVAAPPDLLPTGGTFAVSLSRGGRSLGLLRVVAGGALGRDDLLALAMASELLGSTLANAESFARQQALVERMRSVDELKTVFLATASHELRTPVTAIVGFSAVLLKQWDTTATRARDSWNGSCPTPAVSRP